MSGDKWGDEPGQVHVSGDTRATYAEPLWGVFLGHDTRPTAYYHDENQARLYAGLIKGARVVAVRAARLTWSVK